MTTHVQVFFLTKVTAPSKSPENLNLLYFSQLGVMSNEGKQNMVIYYSFGLAQDPVGHKSKHNLENHHHANIEPESFRHTINSK